MEFTRANIRTWSMLGQRRAYGAILDILAAEHNDIIAVVGDTASSGGLDRFIRNHPDNYVNVGIAEQNMIGVAAGLADSGYVVFSSSFAKFVAMRANEFVAHFMGYMQSPVILVGIGAGFAFEYSGTTHFGIEDISAVRAISNLTILSPADGLELAMAMEQLVTLRKPVYLRLTGVANAPVIYTGNYDFQIGKAVIHEEGSNVAICASGAVLSNVMQAATQLKETGISCTVVDMHTIKPLDTQTLDLLKNHELIVSVEEHSVIGGLGSAIAEYLAESPSSPPLLRLGIKQGYDYPGSYEYLLEKHGLLPAQITESIKNALLSVQGLEE